MPPKRKVKNLQIIVKYLKPFKDHNSGDKIILMTKGTNLSKDFEQLWSIVHEDKVRPKIGMF